MLNTKLNPVGIDFLIQQFQTELYERLMITWNISDDSKYQCFGRVYRNKDGQNYNAEMYAGSGEYKEVYWNDELSAISFFGTGSTEDHKLGDKTEVHLVFFTDLSKLKPLVAHRADEEVRKDVQNIAAEGPYGFKYLSTEIWIDNVLREYSGSRRDNRLSAVDMQPVHCFRLNFEIYYNKNIC
jgi:hypothetical protein